MPHFTYTSPPRPSHSPHADLLLLLLLTANTFGVESGCGYTFPVEEELAALRDAGFDSACLWRAPPIAVVKATKSAAFGE